jgi:hypothetical protein
MKERIKRYMKKGFEKCIQKPARWLMAVTVSDILRKAVPILLFAVVIGASHYYMFSKGRDLGKAEGSCALACAVIGAEYGYTDPDDDSCWCEYGDVVYRNLTLPESE